MPSLSPRRIFYEAFAPRAITNTSDHEEHQWRLDSAICSVFLMPPRGIAEVSSSMVKGLVGPKGWHAWCESMFLILYISAS